ncbi:toprim domain-containing protein [Waddlia chondrophila]|nr:toprim domain-containing protein [Waddlia chondrophila]
MKIKIRRDNWTKQDPLPKYIEVSGSKPSPTIYGDTTKPIIIVESELDAILAQQEASHLVCSVALGGVSKKPDAKLDTILRQAPLILLSLDFDEAGKKHCAFWMRQYSNLRLWPCPFTKSLGDAFQTSPANLIRRPPFLKNKVLNTSLTIPLAVCRL